MNLLQKAKEGLIVKSSTGMIHMGLGKIGTFCNSRGVGSERLPMATEGDLKKAVDKNHFCTKCFGRNNFNDLKNVLIEVR